MVQELLSCDLWTALREQDITWAGRCASWLQLLHYLQHPSPADIGGLPTQGQHHRAGCSQRTCIPAPGRHLVRAAHQLPAISGFFSLPG